VSDPMETYLEQITLDMNKIHVMTIEAPGTTPTL
jgi:hypothetical protein